MMLGAAAALLATSALAGEVAPNAVKVVDSTIPQPLTATPGDAARGKEVFTGRKLGNCLACHQVTELMGEQQFHGEVGPTLDGVGETYTAEELRYQIVNPKLMNPDTIMPAFYRVDGLNRVNAKFEGKTILSAQQVEDVIAYLLTLKDG